MEAAKDAGDPILIPFLESGVEEESERLLASLLSEHAQRLIRGIVWSNLGRISCGASGVRVQSTDTQEIGDVVAEVNLRILEKLRRLKTTPDEPTIGSFKSYVITASYRACHSYLRSKYPNRFRLKARMRYLLTHSPDLALWEGVDGSWLCGLTRWKKSQADPAPSGWIHEAHERHRRFDIGDRDPLGVVRSVFKAAKAPLRLEDLVSIVADILQVKEDVVVGSDRFGESSLWLPTRTDTPNAAEIAEKRIRLERLWQEILQLQLAQRVALLLGLGNARGGASVVLLIDIRIATVQEIAEAVGMPVARFAAIHNELPLGDQAIADYLGVSRQQVYSYRLSARRRLVRRLGSDIDS